MSRTPFPQSEQILALTIGYKHADCIAEQVLPVKKVNEEKFTYTEISLKDSLQLPDTKVGRKSRPNELETSATEKTEHTDDHAIDDFVPNSDLDKARPGYNPRLMAAQATMNVVKLRQELRVKDIVFGSSNYLVDQTEDITATKFSADTTNPIDIIEEAKDKMVVTPNQVTLGQDVYSALRRNPFVVKAVFKNDGDSGIVPLQGLEDLFEMKFIVGRAIFDTAKPGQSVNWSKIWKNHLALQYIDAMSAANEPSLSQGFIAHYDDVGAEIPDQVRGIKGGVIIRAGHQRKEVLTSNLAGYLIQNAV